MAPYGRVDGYFGLRDDLWALLGQEIDLVMAGAVKNLYLAPTSSARSNYSMPRDERAYLSEIVESCEATGARGLDCQCRLVALFAENLRRYSEGLPLLNVVDKQAGY